jgi:PAS domain S-box-containing protein
MNTGRAFSAIRRWVSPRGHWIGLAGAIAGLGVTTAIGLHLMNVTGRAPARIEATLEARNRALTALGLVTAMEADRRAFQLTRMSEHLGALQHDHDRIHEALAGLRAVVADSAPLVHHLTLAEQVIGSWRDEVTAAANATPRRALERDRALLGSAREHLGLVVAAVDSVLRTARQDAAVARVKTRRLWLVVMALALGALAILAELAHRRQRRWQHSAMELRRLLEAMPFAVISLDEDGRVQHATGMATELFGSTQVLIGRRLVERVALPDRAVFAQALDRALAGSALSCETQVRTEFDVVRVLLFAFAPILERGQRIGVSVVVRDATTERAMRIQGRETDRLARVGTMAAGVAHEINGALTAIIGATALVDDRRLDPADRGALATAHAEAQRAARTVRVILDFSRRTAHHHEPVAVAEVLERAVALRRFDPRSHDVEFALQVPRDLPMVMGDVQELLQVFLNLLVNAEQAVRGRPERRVTVEAHRTENGVEIGVADSGPGIPPEHLESVFKPFYTTKPRGEGAGLGLAIARGVVVEHQGTIRAERAAEGGARLVVTLPAVPESEGAEWSLDRAESGAVARPRARRSALNPVADAPPLPGVA